MCNTLEGVRNTIQPTLLSTICRFASTIFILCDSDYCRISSNALFGRLYIVFAKEERKKERKERKEERKKEGEERKKEREERDDGILLARILEEGSWDILF
eukprot:TRINITY_DN1075_c0_g1_i6.p1 TRINITY_DN1075_c0_g1~~TRINITY_DN1075_c0_g1_i6.p1  ORF type:complete len:101 (-),score=19.35 TRINITY_DN1075_c0_g1_i6:449-751(-)